MRLKPLLRAGTVLAAIAAAVAASVMPAGATTQASWHPVRLQLPDGYENSMGYLFAAAGRGGYAGMFAAGDDDLDVVTWTDWRPTVRGVPAGHKSPYIRDENSSEVVLLTAHDSVTGESHTFTLDSHGYHRLTAPDGYSGTVRGVAINDRGDVLATVGDEGKRATVLWQALGSAPIVIPDGPDTRATDLDDDGTILFNDWKTGPSLWRAGVTEKLADPAGFSSPYASSIRNGVVVGSASSTAEPGGRGFVWRTPSTPMELPNSAKIRAIDKTGLIVGQLPDPKGPYGLPTTWQGTSQAGDLPRLGGYKGATAYAIGDDGVIAGTANPGPSDEGGVPVVWQRTP
ncbi:hypothetical protein SAMN05421504_106567 [Amycolatopsis xylanica]|uniref:Extracellular repeat, HAF family n=1 Tax=Amycolatopsis xylanica TaxID=589385 RepID=A0A1H3MBB7_9PSEU|nr:hypothetical protein [Amycolatopsis xylanica]SDY73886.1 hypothetical protein SAMN05421504_106567 [Amycolatopsis xylanica]